jgi:SAM-dependent methyltransferase
MLRRRRDREWRVRSDPVRGRRRALREEVGYWDHWLTTRGGKWSEDYEHRFDPLSEVEDPALRELLAAMPERRVSILDVGAGPISSVGGLFRGTALTVVAVDPLADEYNRLLDRAGLVPPVRTERVEGELLAERFDSDSFDIAYSRNALDHAVDPVLIVEEMLAVVRPGGHVLLRHGRNEAVSEAYVQLHQWNFDERDGQFIVWREGHETNVSEMLAGRAEVTCRSELSDEDGAPLAEDDPGWLVCVIRKLDNGAQGP